MFMSGKYTGIYENIDTKWLKEPQYYFDDCGCKKEYEIIVIDVVPNGNTFKVKTILFRHHHDVFTRAFQPIWDNKKIQKNLKKRKSTFTEKRDRKVILRKERKLTKKDVRDILLSHLIYYEWLQKNMKKEFPDFKKLTSFINTMRFIHKGKADMLNKVYDDDINTFLFIDELIMELTVSKKEFRKYCKDWKKRCEKKFAEMKVKDIKILKGVVCHKCNVPMKKFEELVEFSGKGHWTSVRLYGRKCPKCNFTIYTPKSMKNYLEQNHSHYIIYTDADKTVSKKLLTQEIKDMRKEVLDRHNKFDSMWKHVKKRDDKVLADIRKKGDKSKYFGAMNKKE